MAFESATCIHQLLRNASMQIDRREAEMLLLHVLGRERAWLFAHADAVPRKEACVRFDALVARRVAGEPVAYLTGTRGFWSLDLQVTTDTLIPRPETELLVDLALQRLPADRTCRLADLGTGSGAVALAVASERELAQVLATDASAAALTVAQDNAQRLGLVNVDFAQGDWLEPLAGRSFDVIVSNPPYIEADDLHLGQGDLRFEPAAALASGTDGLDAIRVIVRDAFDHLGPGGWLLLEHGWNQGAAVRALLQAAAGVEVFTTRDVEGRERVSGARKPLV
ncbi:MAG TPA: peptide chain release factor N(5)-glutamine methyltransferase [Rhodanobacteraceae bacterium]